MRYSIAVAVLITTIAWSYGYWDLYNQGTRVEYLSPVSAALAGATLPEGTSSLNMFSNPSSLSSLEDVSVSFIGWGTGWREDIFYNPYCDEPVRANKGGMTPRFAAAVAVPIDREISVGAGIATVAQYEMMATTQVYHEPFEGRYELWKTMMADGSGDQREALLSVSGRIGRFNLGVSPGLRFGTGEITTFSNRATGTHFDSTYHEEWEVSEFALRGGAATTLGYTRLYSSFVSGGDRYKSAVSVGAAASYPFLNGGFLGTEIGVYGGSDLKVTAYSRLPWAFDGANYYMGVTGYRPENAFKMGLGVSFGVDHQFGNNRVTGIYSWQSRYRENTAVDLPQVNWIYDSGQSLIIGYERLF